MKKYFGVVLFLIVTVICLSGCVGDLVTPEGNLDSAVTEDDSTSPTQEDGVVPGKGILKIYLTDSSGNYKENDSGTYSAVYITISKIEAHIAGDGEEEEDKGSWEVLKEWSGGLQVDLIKLEDSSMLLASLELEPNKYTQLRLFLMDEEEDAWIVLNDLGSTEKPLEIPSVYQTGIKLNHPFEIVTDGITKLTIDFDAEKSVVKTGNGEYKLKPVINMTSEIYLEGEVSTGSVSGTVSYYYSQDLELTGIGGASVSLSGGEYIFVYNTTTSEVEDFVGEFELDNVPVGNCVLNVYAVGYGDYFESIEVIKDLDTAVNVVFLLEAPGRISGIVLEDSETGPPISGATVSFTLSGGVYTFNSSADTNESGEFVIEQLPVGVYDLKASAIGYDEYTAGGIGVTEGTTTDIEIKLKLTPETPTP